MKKIKLTISLVFSLLSAVIFYGLTNPLVNAQSESSNRIFLSSQNYKGNLGGLSGADSKCQTLADQASLNGTFKAWLSDSQTSAKDRLSHSDKPYKRLDGKTVADNWSDLTDALLKENLKLTEKGKSEGKSVWTGTSPDGSKGEGGNNCDNWSSENGKGLAGKSDKIDKEWTKYKDENCDSSYRIYCIETSAVSSPSPSQTASSSASPSPSAPQCSDTLDNDSDGNIDSADPNCHTDSNAGNNNSYVPSDNSEAPDSDPNSRTAFYRIAQTSPGLDSAEYIPYLQEPVIANLTLTDDKPGIKQIWVEFKSQDGKTKKEHINVELLEKTPKVDSITCTLDINKQDLKVTLLGSEFGDGQGKMEHNTTALEVLEWKNNKVTGILKKPTLSDENKSFLIKLTKNNGIGLEGPVLCRVDTSLIALGAKVFCRESGKFDVAGVKLKIKDQDNNSIDEVVSISKDGTISGIKNKLQSGKMYVVSIKAPGSLRRNILFTASEGTTFVNQENGVPFFLPVGDIAPAILPDGKINTLDRSEIVRQWSVLGKGTPSSGDLNRDSRVNSIDWACMRYDFNEEDEIVPDGSILLPTPIPTTASTPAPSSTPTGSVIGDPCGPGGISPCPSPSTGARAAYFLPEASGSGTYVINSEFSVDINLWSQNEAANLFNAQMSFDPAALEVVRIEKGSVLTSWTESVFDNTTGKISLVAGLPSPGLKTVEGTDPLMARLVFKGKQAGGTTITMTPQSAIYSNSDNANIISGFISAPVIITQ